MNVHDDFLLSPQAVPPKGNISLRVQGLLLPNLAVG
jgi:hypothetical protein